jgi:hypothetical protein
MIRQSIVSNKEVWIPSAVPLFLFGFIYYLISPAVVFQFFSDDNHLLSAAATYINPSFFNISYFLDAIIILVSFLLGYFFARAGTNTRISSLDYGAYQSSFPLLLAISFFVLIVYFALTAVASGAGFFTGYSTYNISVLGPFSTCVFMAAWFVNYFSIKKISLLFLFFFVFCSVLLLGWGSRMFFVLSFMALMFGLVSKNRKLLKSPWFYSFIVVAGLFMIVVGIVRQGGGELTGDKLIAIFFAEPLFTSVTGSLYLEYSGGRPVFGVPYDLFASIIHFIPSAVYPGKVELINAITYNENIISPFGATALIVNLYSNFGFFYPIFMVFLGSYFGFLYRKAHYSVFYRATYFSALPIILLLFFRDNLVTVMKVMFFNGLIVPLFVSLLLLWLSPRTLVDIKQRIYHKSISE